MDPHAQRPSIPFYAKILIAMVAGAAFGFALGPRAGGLGEIGRVLIQAIKALAGPLLFLAIVDAFIRTQVRWRSAARMAGISLTNAGIALGIGLSLSNLLRPGEHLSLGELALAKPGSPKLTEGLAGSKIDFVKAFSGYIPSNWVQPFVENSVISLVLMAVLVGLALRRVKLEETSGGDAETAPGWPMEKLVASALRANEWMLTWLTRLIPVAVFGVMAKTVGEQGWAPFRGLAAYLAVALLGLLLQVGVVYQLWIFVAARMSLRAFWRGARDPVAYALGASSSLATLPVTLRALDRMGVSPQSARLSACVGTNLNNDGILLYEAMAVLFVAQAYGIELSLGQQALAAVSCLVAGFGIAGVPEAGLISLALVLTTVGLPTEILPLLLTVDWILSRARAMTNVTSDMLVAVLLDRFAGSRSAGPDSAKN